MRRHLLVLIVLWLSACRLDAQGPSTELEQMRKQLRDANPAVRAKALQSLTMRPKLVQELADEVLTLSKDADAKVRQQAVQPLGVLISSKIRAEEALKALRERFSDSEESVRLLAIRAGLTTAAPQLAGDAVPALVALLRSQKQYREEALSLLRRTGEHGKAARPELLDVIKTGSLTEQMNAVETMEVLQLDLKPVLPDLAKRAGLKPDGSEAEVLTRVLARHDMPEAALAVRALLLRDGHGHRTALSHTMLYKQTPQLAMKAVIPLLKDADPKARANAAVVLANLDVQPRDINKGTSEMVLQELAKSSKELVENLRANLKEKADEVRWFSAIALVMTKSPAARETVPLAVEWLKQADVPRPNFFFNDQHLELGGVVLGVDPGQAARLVEAAVPTSDHMMQERWARAMRKFPDATLTPHLIKAVQSKNVTHKSYAFILLHQLFNPARTDVLAALDPHVETLLDDMDIGVRLEAAKHLLSRGKKQHARIIAVMVKLLDEKEVWPRQGALSVLERMGKDAVRATPALLRALDDPAPTVQLRSAQLLIQIDRTKTEPVIAVLKRSLEKPNPLPNAFSLVVELGPAAQPLVPNLLALVENRKSPVRIAAGNTLLRIDLKQSEPVRKAVLEVVADTKGQALGDRRVIEMLRQFGPTAKSALPAVLQAYEKAQKSRRISLALTAVVLDPADNNPAARHVRDALAGKGEDGIESTLDVLAEFETLGPSAKVFLPELLALLRREKTNSVLYEVVTILAEIGADAKAALPDLEALAKRTKNEGLRKEIKRTIAQIAGK